MDQQMSSAVDELVAISQAVGHDPSQVQGGGGNTSVKFASKRMAIKASGFELSGVSRKTGYAVVDAGALVEALKSSRWADPSAISWGLKTFEVEGHQARPSIETGFHALLGRVVIHTHSVYANLLTCRAGGRGIAEALFAEAKVPMLWVPFAAPGFALTRLLSQALEECRQKDGSVPPVVLLENHGLIVHDENTEPALALNREVNRLIRAHFGIVEPYPQVKLRELGDGCYASATPLLHRLVTQRPSDVHRLLFPDQIVYLLQELPSILRPMGGKISLDDSRAPVVYRSGPIEAKAMEETFVALAYLLETMRALGCEPQSLPESYLAEIGNMEQEKYRKAVASRSEATS